MFLSTLLAAAAAVNLASASSLKPSVLPLIVRNPYLSTWLGNARGVPWDSWPIFWNGDTLGFAVLAGVPETRSVYPLLGRAQDALSLDDRGYNISYPDYSGASFDASTTNLTYTIPSVNTSVQDVDIILSFLSPITPTSTMRQSIPASYLTVHVSGGFEIEVYIDVNGEWVTANRDNPISWSFTQEHPVQPEVEGKTQDAPLTTWKVKRTIEQDLTEIEGRDRAEWGTLHFTGPSDANFESGESTMVRQGFATNRTLNNVVDSNYRSVMDREPIFALSKSFKLNSTSSYDSALFTFAHVQDPVIQYASARGMTMMKPLWASYIPDASHLIYEHYYDFGGAFNLASNYSLQLEKDALVSGSEDYKDILALSARQVLGATSFAGTPENPLIFFKEISSDGNMNTVDVIYPAFPFFLYTNPRWLAWLMEPLLEHQLSGQYPNKYSMHDLGSSFPNATGHPDGLDEKMPVEECGNMLIMGLALVNSLKYNTLPASIWQTMGKHIDDGDYEGSFPLIMDAEWMDDTFGGSIDSKGEKQARQWIEKTYKLWDQWTGFLVNETLIPTNQLCTDDFAGELANNTNLALKGILGIRAMSEIADLVGNTQDAKRYKEISSEYIKTWTDKYAFHRSGTHVKLAYQLFNSWTTLYNLFADSLLCFHLDTSSSDAGNQFNSQQQSPLTDGPTSKTGFVDEKVYKLQSVWYDSVRQKYGLPLDYRHMYAKSDWEFFAAAVASKRVREDIVDSVALWVNETSTDNPFTDLYETDRDGGYPRDLHFRARPVVGGHFAFLALERACGGKAVEGLAFLNEDDKIPASIERLTTGDGEL